jgi:hypothetical protein
MWIVGSQPHSRQSCSHLGTILESSEFSKKMSLSVWLILE